MKITSIVLLTATLVSCGDPENDISATGHSQHMAVPGHKPWHVTEGLSNDPVSLPSCSMDSVQRLSVGDSLDEVKSIVGHDAVQYYNQNRFSVLHAVDSGESGYYWEVALKHGKGRTVTDISFRKVSVDSSL